MFSQGAGIARSRLTVVGTLPKTLYNLSVNAPNADKTQLSHATAVAIASAAGLTIAYKTAETDALVLTALPSGAAQFTPGASEGFSYYDKKTHTLTCVSASADQIARSLESAVGKPVVNESGLQGVVSVTIAIPSNDVAAANDVVAKQLGVTLTPAKRPIETVVITVPAEATKEIVAKP